MRTAYPRVFNRKEEDGFSVVAAIGPADAVSAPVWREGREWYAEVGGRRLGAFATKRDAVRAARERLAFELRQAAGVLEGMGAQG
jgi:hypothetical protein